VPGSKPDPKEDIEPSTSYSAGELGPVQKELGLVDRTESYIIQIKNPLAPASGPMQVRGKQVQYPARLMRDVFGCSERLLTDREEIDASKDDDQVKDESENKKEETQKKKRGPRTGGNTKGRESYGLRFTSCETPELLDYVGAQLILIVSKVGMEGLAADIGEDRAKGELFLMN